MTEHDIMEKRGDWDSSSSPSSAKTSGGNAAVAITDEPGFDEFDYVKLTTDKFADRGLCAGEEGRVVDVLYDDNGVAAEYLVEFERFHEDSDLWVPNLTADEIEMVKRWRPK